MWDRRTSIFPSFELTTNCSSAINSIKMDADNQVIFGANKHGIIFMWDLRGGSTSSAFQNNRMASYSPLTSVKLASELEKIDSLKLQKVFNEALVQKNDCQPNQVSDSTYRMGVRSNLAQSNIVSKEILSIDINPSCPYQLGFHLDDGWSGVFDIHNSQVTHIHCPPPAWLEDFNDLAHLSYLRKPCWLPIYSVYAVGSSSSKELNLLDFYPDSRSPCHVEYDEDSQGNRINGRQKQNTYVPLSDVVTACAAHPLNGAIIAGTQQSSLLLISQTTLPHGETHEPSH
ncbi:hypothetical protein M9H77_06208 [Catharanthus roseus]|uniref:Uncharacterized protein n=1 Tax=Catharanthus roseus TaxID=4058 RepID=A0ACC0BRM4_CATRO|nr:hypothetical protein M9H77_06208 [Catharanthus roseus]